MIDFIALPTTVHNYQATTGGNGNAATHDGDTATYGGASGADTASGSGGSYGATATCISSHLFPSPVTIRQMKFRPYATVSSTSTTDNAARCSYALQYRLNGSAAWNNFTGGTGSAGSGSSSGGNSGSLDPGLLTIDEVIANIIEVRLTVTNSGSFHNDNGSHSWDLRLYEIQAYGDIGGYAGII